MEIQRIENGKKLKLVLHGKMDTTTAPVLEKEVTNLSAFEQLYIDLTDVPYISSAGLRVFLLARKQLQSKESIVLCGASQDVKDVLEITGLVDIMTIEE